MLVVGTDPKIKWYGGILGQGHMRAQFQAQEKVKAREEGEHHIDQAPKYELYRKGNPCSDQSNVLLSLSCICWLQNMWYVGLEQKTEFSGAG